MSKGELPLAGIRVADFTWFGAGPIYPQVLANHGPQVIRVESQSRIDGLRLAHPMPEGKYTWNVSGYYNNFNASKLSLALNMKHPKALAVALRLIAISDIVAENYTAGTLEKWGLSYEAMLAVKPDIILVREPMQGAGGPHGDFGGFGFVIPPLAGGSPLSGFPPPPGGGHPSQRLPPPRARGPGHQLHRLRHHPRPRRHRHPGRPSLPQPH